MGTIETNVMSVLKSVFGYANFKNEMQKNATIAISEGSKYVYISMPPGFGRSLCYQLPILLHKHHIGVVFSPKLSFAKLEVDFLKSKQVKAALLSKCVPVNETHRVVNDLKSKCPTIALLYVTPEISAMTFFEQLISSLKDRGMLSYIVFNDAHCLSEWGFDYVSSYKNINVFEKICKYVPKIIVTPTVTTKVMEDVFSILTLKTPKVFNIPVQQLNVYYDVWFVDILPQPFDHLKNFIVEVIGFLEPPVHKIHKGFAIIYCKEVVTAEMLKDKLNASGISTLVYHHKLNKTARCTIESKWISGGTGVIITTYDYGFIYAQSIRCIVYWTVPENIAKYYRQCAQTCISDDRTYCRIYFSIKEYTSVKWTIENHRAMHEAEHIKKRLNEYNKIVSYCLSIKNKIFLRCRHVTISNYFGKVLEPCKTNCDVCENEEMLQSRILKFIMYSENIKGLKYNICEFKEDQQETQLEPDSKEQSERSVKTGCKKLGTLNKKVSVFNCTDKWIEQPNNKLLESAQKCTFTENSAFRIYSANDCIQISTDNTVKCANDDSSPIQASKIEITQSLHNKYNLDKKAISLEICRTKNNSKHLEKRIINAQAGRNNKRVQKNETRIENSNKRCETQMDKWEDQISRRDSEAHVVIETKRPHEKRKKRSINVDTCPEDYKTKRRKLEPENKPTTVTGINGNRGNSVNSRVERITNDTNGNASRDHATIEYFMNKYKLCRHSITLELRRK